MKEVEDEEKRRRWRKAFYSVLDLSDLRDDHLMRQTKRTYHRFLIAPKSAAAFFIVQCRDSLVCAVALVGLEAVDSEFPSREDTIGIN